MPKPKWDYMIYIPGQAYAVRIVTAVDPDGVHHAIPEDERERVVKYLTRRKRS